MAVAPGPFCRELVPPPSVMFPSYNPGTAVWATCWRCHRASVSPLTDEGHPRFPVTRAHPQPELAPRGPFTVLVWIQSDCNTTSSIFGSYVRGGGRYAVLRCGSRSDWSSGNHREVREMQGKSHRSGITKWSRYRASHLCFYFVHSVHARSKFGADAAPKRTDWWNEALEVP